jgi:MFS family permease
MPSPAKSALAPPRPFAWWRDASSSAKRALVAASLGWMLNSFDVMLYSLVLASLLAGLHLTKASAGILGSVTLLAAAAGGLIFGVIADRFGRTRALMASVLIYAVFTAACGLAHSFVQLAVFRILLGLGMGGEWASGASLVSDTWPAEHRGKALGFMQSGWAIGYALAAAVAYLILPRWGWRAVFFAGILPALLVLWIRSSVEEPAAWTATRAALSRDPHKPSPFHAFAELFNGRLFRLTTAITLMNACCLFAWWGFNLWVPAYLALPVAQGGIGLTSRAMSITVIAMQAGMWLGYITFGYVSDLAGRKRTYVAYLLTAAALLLIYGTTRSPLLLLILGPFVAFFATGYYTGLAVVTADIYETRIRSTAQGFTYNLGRVASAVAPFTVGSLAQKHGFGAAFGVSAAAFLLAAFCWLWIPETRVLPDGPPARGAVSS